MKSIIAIVILIEIQIMLLVGVILIDHQKYQASPTSNLNLQEGLDSGGLIISSY